MRIFISFFILFFKTFIQAEELQPQSDVKLSYTLLPPYEKITAGSTIQFTCETRLFLPSFENPPYIFRYFLHKSRVEVTQCIARNPRYEVVQCNSSVSSSPVRVQVTTLIVRLHNITWLDRGEWTCTINGKHDKVRVDVLVDGVLEPLAADSYLNHTKIQQILPPPANSLQAKSPRYHKDIVLRGQGTKSEPLDLREYPWVYLRLKCRASCSNPAGVFSWDAINENGAIDKQNFNNFTVSQWSYDSCMSDNAVEGMQSGTSEYTFHCSHVQRLLGVVEVGCHLLGSIARKQQTIFVLCQDNAADDTWNFTTFSRRLEFFLIVLAVASALLLLCTCICICVCDHRKSKFKIDRKGEQRYQEYLQRKIGQSPGATKESLFVCDESLNTFHSNGTSLLGTSRSWKDEQPQIAYV